MADQQEANRQPIKLKFRNYTPSAVVAKEVANITNAANGGRQADQDAVVDSDTHEQDGQDGQQQEDEAIDIGDVIAMELPSAKVERDLKEHVARIVQEDVDAEVMLVPDKANWDLKRDVHKKLRILERQTQRAISQLVDEQHR